MKSQKVSVVRFLYKPEKEVYERISEMLKKQTIKAEIIENWNMPSAKSINKGVKEAKGEIVVILAQDCVPEDEFWLERLIKPLEDKEIIGVSSDLHLPEEHWKKNSFFTMIFTIADRNDRRPGMDMRGCAFRKKDLIEVGLLNENPKVIGIDAEIHTNLSKKGKFAHPGIRVLHLHQHNGAIGFVKRVCVYSEGNGKFIRNGGIGAIDTFIRVIKAIPFFGIIFLIGSFPFKKHFNLFPAYILFAVPILHVVNVLWFWKGFLLDKTRIRDKELSKKKD